MSQPTPPSPAPPSAPPPPGQDSARPKGQPDKGPGGEPPVEVRRARNLYTVVAAFLVFIGITSLMGVPEAAVEMRRLLNEADAEMSEQITSGMITALLVLTGVATLMVAIGHGLTAQALDGGRSWSRPLGLTFSGILLGLAALNLFSGAQVMPSFFFAIAGLLGISLLNRPEVRDYLRPRWGGPNDGRRGPGGPPGPGGFPPGPPPTGPPVGHEGQPGSWSQPNGQQPQAPLESGNRPSGENHQN